MLAEPVNESFLHRKIGPLRGSTWVVIAVIIILAGAGVTYLKVVNPFGSTPSDILSDKQVNGILGGQWSNTPPQYTSYFGDSNGALAKTGLNYTSQSGEFYLVLVKMNSNSTAAETFSNYTSVILRGNITSGSINGTDFAYVSSRINATSGSPASYSGLIAAVYGSYYFTISYGQHSVVFTFTQAKQLVSAELSDLRAHS